MIIQETLDELITRINSVRHLMVSTGLRKSLCDCETLKYSEELDELIHNYQLVACSRLPRSG
ncbi:aspartyl-phosphate phosphatase Spo0E family protein [Bacillus badius]|uniref:aspartyl-phosphate phosphatase Spo0E family protein n=1 Tax=Bacillus badius TaxID=1455 RepID=UPI000B42CC85|nr:aspartyl-phosphate phosphatase Spo0E family protein [Bacillus badius]MED0665013.1 aspartyl-phosphate phosphatase Spo0E family protein [Bacillus badius]MED4717958.1 aspartyl-phosphate phosphatase Spo0E family protein [Bacillus badius]OVE52698.1 hypothetical protein B1A98_03615 [Bacillus badius]UAT29155.1 aspartyl-phosphate phosphatase Spo0E family protein [Bacillus badius]GLY09692.1 hypothetical protein Bbad01_09080 [Bacillus badius]